MVLPLTLMIFGPASLLLLALIAASRHKKKTRQHLPFKGAEAITASQLNPEGTVLFRGEIWRARCDHDTKVDVRAAVKVIGLRDHLLLVQPL